jgi:lysophospholipase L1-like esterase
VSRPIVAALGDSLTLGEHADAGVDIHNHPWPALLDANLFPEAGVANYGKGGDTIQQMQVRYTAYVKGIGFDALILWCPVNNIIADDSAASIWAATEALIDEAMADGLPVYLIGTPGFRTYAGWSAPRQAVLLEVLALMAGKAGVSFLSFYETLPTGLDDPDQPEALDPTLRISDGLHINPTGAIYVADSTGLLALLRLRYPVPAAPPTGSPVGAWG